jgi:phage tail sheath protein FI
MPIYQQGSLNTTALIVPDLYVQIVPPQNLLLNGVPTNTIGMVGTSSWGPVNQPVIVGTMADYATSFGPVVVRKYDMGTNVATAVQQGASAFRCVRVSDGTDTAASYAIAPLNGAFSLGFTARYTGVLGNSITFSLGAGSNPMTWRLTIALPGRVPELFDNIAAPSPTIFWQNLASAVNNGMGPLRGNSQLVVASLGTPAALETPPAVIAGQPLLGGTDGAGAAVTAATLVGQETSLPRTGMYVLRGQGCSIGVLCDSDDPTQWNTQAAFGSSEGIYMILTGPAGDNLNNAAATIQQSGLNAVYSAKLMFGDWIYWFDQTNAVTRIVSPQGFVAGLLANMSPEQSSLNKPLYSIIGTQSSGTPGTSQFATYSDAELQFLFQNGIDVITNPQPGGAYWGVRCGHNTCIDPATNGDNYSRMTNFIAATLAAGMGQFVGQVINAGLFNRIRATQLSYLNALYGQGILGSIDGSLPFSVICDSTNNPISRTSLGYVQSDAQVQFQGINEKFIVNVEGGQTVVVQRQILPAS